MLRVAVAVGAATGLLVLAIALVGPKYREVFVAAQRRGPVEKNAIVHASGSTWRLAFMTGSWRRAPVPRLLDVYQDLPSRNRYPFTSVAVEAEVVRGAGEARVYVLTTRFEQGRSPGLDEKVADTLDDRLEEWKRLEPTPLAGRVGPTALHGTATHRGERVEVLCAIAAEPPNLTLVVALASAPRFAELRAELENVLESFRPGDAEPRPAAAR